MGTAHRFHNGRRRSGRGNIRDKLSDGDGPGQLGRIFGVLPEGYRPTTQGLLLPSSEFLPLTLCLY